MKKHPELAKMMKAKPEMAQKPQAAAQKGGKEMNAALKQMEHSAYGFQGGAKGANGAQQAGLRQRKCAQAQAHDGRAAAVCPA